MPAGKPIASLRSKRVQHVRVWRSFLTDSIDGNDEPHSAGLEAVIRAARITIGSTPPRFQRRRRPQPGATPPTTSVTEFVCAKYPRCADTVGIAPSRFQHRPCPQLGANPSMTSVTELVCTN